MRVLFLDIDGVLHRYRLVVDTTRTVRGKPVARYEPPVQYFQWLPILVDLLAPYPDVAVVVHSTWRLNQSETELMNRLEPLAHRRRGVTVGAQRWESLQRWLTEHPEVTDHAILDDTPSEFPVPTPPQLIVCSPETGISNVDVQAALTAWLANSPGRDT